jgi:hypothetical protein
MSCAVQRVFVVSCILLAHHGVWRSHRPVQVSAGAQKRPGFTMETWSFAGQPTGRYKV